MSAQPRPTFGPQTAGAPGTKRLFVMAVTFFVTQAKHRATEYGDNCECEHTTSLPVMSGASTLSDDEAINSLRGALFQGKLCEPQRAAVIPHGHTATHLQACLRDFSSNCSYGKPRGFE